MNSKFDKLFEQFEFPNGATIKNRLIMAPMTTWAANDDGTISEAELSYYASRVNGVGMAITGCSHVTENGVGFSNEFAAYDDKFIPSLKKLADTLKAGGAKAILQILHAGNKAIPALIPNGDVVSSSPVETESTAFVKGLIPRELSHEEILEMIQSFGETTRRAIEAGFDGIELHGAHGFLFQNFFSPYFNQRTDEWGGSLENRLRFPLEVVKEVKKVIKEYSKSPFILGYRFSPDEPQERGLRFEDTKILINHLIEEELDYVHASLSNVLTAKPIDSEDEKTILELIIETVDNKIPLLAAGTIRKPDTAIQAVELGLPLVVLGQALVINPTWAELVKNGEEDKIETKLNLSKTEELFIPEKLSNVIKAMNGWFEVE